MNKKSMNIYIGPNDKEVVNWIESERKKFVKESGVEVKTGPFVMSLLRKLKNKK